MSRTFQRIDKRGNAVGHFVDSSPYKAASKAFSSLMKERKSKGLSTSGKITFSIRESSQTRGKDDNGVKREIVKTYQGQRIKSDTPPVTFRGKRGKEVTIKHKYKNVIYKA